jgi:hypothetical protein
MLKKIRQKKQQKHAYGEKTQYLVLACKVRANLALGRVAWNYQDKKTSCPTCFFCHPIKYLLKFFSRQTKEIWG